MNFSVWQYKVGMIFAFVFVLIQIPNCSSNICKHDFPLGLLWQLCKKSNDYPSVGSFLGSLLCSDDLYVSYKNIYKNLMILMPVLLLTTVTCSKFHFALLFSRLLRLFQVICISISILKSTCQFLYETCKDFGLDYTEFVATTF